MTLNGKTIGAILLMGGHGERFGGDLPKQFHPLLGKKVYQHALHTLQDLACIDKIILVTHPKWLHLVEETHILVSGGATRQESTYLGLQAFSKELVDIVLIHDAVRPFVSKKILISNLEMAIKWGAVDTCIPSRDTLVYAPQKDMITSIPKREEFLRGQTPQTFRMDWIVEAHKKALEIGTFNASDDCKLVLDLGKQIHIVEGDERNFKITSELDLHFAKFVIEFPLLENRQYQ